MPSEGVCSQCCGQMRAFVSDVNNDLYRVGSTESTIVFVDFNAYVGIVNETWKGVIGRHKKTSL